MSHAKDKHDGNRPRIDRLLRDWAAGESPDEAHLDGLRGRILEATEALDGGEAGAATASPPARPLLCPAHAPRWRGRLAWFLLGVGAAAVVVAVAMVCRETDGIPGAESPSQSLAAVPPAAVPPEVRIERSQLVAFARLLAEMNRVFPDRLTWVAETDGRVLLGLEPPDQTAQVGAEAITVRLVVMGRGPGETQWSPRWSLDCIAYDQQLVELTPEEGSPRRLALWAHVLPDGMIAVDTDLALDTPQREPLSSTSVQRSQVPQQILDVRAGGSEYRVFQTVAVLPKEVG